MEREKTIVEELIEESEYQSLFDEADSLDRDIYICLNCGHLQHYHTNLVTGETSDECRKIGCDCQSYSPEICN